ncbi:MAG: DUF4340 domain-containing protein [Chloroflexi bacterium]|nr:DUF4340 domain-containing protein [Chloroflexota bacterium]
MGRSTLAMVLVFAVLAVAVWVLQTKNPAPAEGAPTYALEVEEGSITRLDVSTPSGSAAFEKLEPFGWKFASGDAADFNRVSSVVNRLSKLRTQAKVLDQVTDRTPYKLDSPRVIATLTARDGAQHQVLFGGQTVSATAAYVLVEGKGQLYTVSSIIIGDLERLVTEPPVPTPTLTTPSTSEATATPTTPDTLTPTIGLPAPSVQ